MNLCASALSCMLLMFVSVGQKFRFLESNCVCDCASAFDDRLTTVLVHLAGCSCLVLRLNLLCVMHLLVGLCLMLFWGVNG